MLSFERRGRDFVNSYDVQLVEHRRDPVVHVLRPVVGVEGQGTEGKRADERLEHGDHVVLGDLGNARKSLELRHFVDHVDHVGSPSRGPGHRLWTEAASRSWGVMSAGSFPSRKERMWSSVRIRSVQSVTIMLP